MSNLGPTSGLCVKVVPGAHAHVHLGLDVLLARALILTVLCRRAVSACCVGVLGVLFGSGFDLDRAVSACCVGVLCRCAVSACCVGVLGVLLARALNWIQSRSRPGMSNCPAFFPKAPDNRRLPMTRPKKHNDLPNLRLPVRYKLIPKTISLSVAPILITQLGGVLGLRLRSFARFYDPADRSRAVPMTRPNDSPYLQ